jgi:hypothetical protein
MSTEALTCAAADPGNSTQRQGDVTRLANRGGSVFIVDFHENGNSAPYRTFGWSGQEETHVWSLGRGCGLHLPPPVEETPLVLEIDFDICKVGSLLTTALIRVIVNEMPIGTAAAKGRSRLRCSIPPDLIRAGAPIDVRLEHACYVRLDFADLGTDDRALGLCVYSVLLYPPWLQPAAGALLPHADGERVIEPVQARPGLTGESSERAIYRFGSTADDRSSLQEGWRFDESGNAWADARICHLELPAPTEPGRYLARFDLVPLCIRTVLVSQRITLLLNGAVIGQFRTGTDTILSVPLPEELFEVGGKLRFSFVVPDGFAVRDVDPRLDHQFLSFILDSIAIEPIPPRHAALARLRDDDVIPLTPTAVSERFLDESIDELPRAVKAELGVEVSEILRIFESLGDNCAFGLAQQKAGGEVLGMLRFANSPLKPLMGAFEDEFRSVGDKTKIELRWLPSGRGEFVLASEYGLRWHTNVFDPSADRPTLFAQQAMRLSYLRRKFYEGLKAGRKIYTISRAEPRKQRIPMPPADEPEFWEEKPEPLRLAELLPLFLLLNGYGNNTLLYLVPCERGRRSGTVELIAPGIMRGYVENFVIVPDPEKKDHAAWLRVAVNAWLLEKGPDASFRKPRAG